MEKNCPIKRTNAEIVQKKELKKIFAENPDLKQAYKEALEETFSPENRKKMADDICKFANMLNALRGNKGKVD